MARKPADGQIGAARSERRIRPPVGDTPPRLHFFRAGAWPESAPPPAGLRSTAEDVALRIVAETGDTARWPLDEMVIHANRKVGISLRPRRSRSHRMQLRLHWSLLLMPEQLIDAVVPALHDGYFPAWLSEHLSELSLREDVRRTRKPQRRTSRRTAGDVHDLSRAAATVHRLLPELGPSPPTVQWGRRRRWKGRPRRQIRLGSARIEDGIITIHPVLDQEFVPEYVVRYVMFHEFCHLIAPPLTPRQARSARENRIHHRAFRDLEARCPQRAESCAWIERHMPKLLAYDG